MHRMSMAQLEQLFQQKLKSSQQFSSLGHLAGVPHDNSRTGMVKSSLVL
jgi:hypothetical protein